MLRYACLRKQPLRIKGTAKTDCSQYKGPFWVLDFIQGFYPSLHFFPPRLRESNASRPAPLAPGRKATCHPTAKPELQFQSPLHGINVARCSKCQEAAPQQDFPSKASQSQLWSTFPQRKSSPSSCSWHQMASTRTYASGEHLKPAHRASSNLRKLFHLAAGRKNSSLCIRATCPSPRERLHHKCMHESTWLGTAPSQHFLAPKSLESGNCSQPVTSSWSSDSQPVLFRTPRGFISATTGFQVPAILGRHCVFNATPNNGSGSLPWECFIATFRVLHLY